MGLGYVYNCSRCGNEFHVFFGGGFAYDDILDEETDKVRKGEYGEKLKKLLESDKAAILDVDYLIFRCDNCGSWERKCDMSVIKPAHLATEIENEQLRYYPPGNNRYVLLEEYIYYCEKCGSKMNKLTYETIDKLECPECGELCEKCGGCFWD